MVHWLAKMYNIVVNEAQGSAMEKATQEIQKEHVGLILAQILNIIRKVWKAV